MRVQNTVAIKSIVFGFYSGIELNFDVAGVEPQKSADHCRHRATIRAHVSTAMRAFRCELTRARVYRGQSALDRFSCRALTDREARRRGGQAAGNFREILRERLPVSLVGRFV